VKSAATSSSALKVGFRMPLSVQHILEENN